MLVRDGASGPEVYVQRRVATMAFAPSTVVFPGGGVDPADAALPVSTPGLAELAAAMGVDGRRRRRRIAAAAVREVEEECGVRLSVADLRGRAHWVTPEFEPRRYDTWILAAGMPAGQEATGTTTESDHSAWVRPRDLLARHAAGEVRMLPPTVVSLEQLAGSVPPQPFSPTGRSWRRWCRCWSSAPTASRCSAPRCPDPRAHGRLGRRRVPPMRGHTGARPRRAVRRTRRWTVARALGCPSVRSAGAGPRACRPSRTSRQERSAQRTHAWLAHDVLEGEPEGGPAEDGELGVPPAVLPQAAPGAVVLEPVGLHREPELLAPEVDDGVQPRRR